MQTHLAPMYVEALQIREDRIQFSPPFPGAAIGATPALVQAGVAFYGPDVTSSQLSWHTLQLTDLRAADFTSVAATHPDFGPTGGLIQFGFTRGNTNSSGVNAILTRHGIDGWAFTVHGSGVTGVEEIVGPAAPVLRVLGPNPFSRAIAFRLSVPEVLPVDREGPLREVVASGRVAGRPFPSCPGMAPMRGGTACHQGSTLCGCGPGVDYTFIYPFTRMSRSFEQGFSRATASELSNNLARSKS